MATKTVLCFLVALFIPLSFAMIRKDRYKQAIFHPEKDMALTGHVISIHHVTSPIDCSFLCMSTYECKSHDYQPNAGLDSAVCKLNNATKHNNLLLYLPSPGNKHYEPKVFKSCLDYLKIGASENGIYTITDTSGDPFDVFCDLTSEPRSAWTLIFSFAFKNRLQTPFRVTPFTANSPVEQDTPNWEAYRLSLERMIQQSKLSSHARFTTGFAEYGVDFTDYLRAKISELDFMTDLGNDICKTVEYVNIRGNIGIDVTVPFWQRLDEILHMDSSYSPCVFNGTSGAAVSENNFGFYVGKEFNSEFRGSANSESTTEYWFGGYL